MKIEVKRSGGFARITSTFLVDQKTATTDEINELKRLVNEAGFLNYLQKFPVESTVPTTILMISALK